MKNDKRMDGTVLKKCAIEKFGLRMVLVQRISLHRK